MQFTYNIYFGNGEQEGKITARNMIRRENSDMRTWVQRGEEKRTSILNGKNAVRKAEIEIKNIWLVLAALPSQKTQYSKFGFFPR
jgi:hypothetical protein